MSSRFLNPTTPGGLLSNTADNLTPGEELVIQAITDGTYFVENETPSGTINGSNTVFTLAGTPNPAASLELKTGIYLANSGVDYTLSGNTITFVTAPDPGTVMRASYRVSPV